MDNRINKIAALANISAYGIEGTKDYVDGAPHVKHASLRKLYGELAIQVFDEARKHNRVPKVLDVGAGEGSVTLTFLELGAKVVATDISQSQIAALRVRCANFGDMLETHCEDINDTFNAKTDKYDVVVFNSFLHHIPDYMEMLEKAICVLSPNGVVFSFQDPVRYDTMSKLALIFSKSSYYWWRIFKGDVIGGARRQLRRRRGIYLEDSPHDNAEYHVGRNGVDQKAIYDFFTTNGFDCTLKTYFSTQSYLFQPIGTVLGLHNTFAIVAKRIVD